MYMLDTNACIDFARGRGEGLRAKVREHLRSGLAMSAITYGELMVGARNSTDRVADHRRLDVLVRFIRVHDFNHSAAEAYGGIARQIGVKRKSFDRLIAAHAIALGLTLVTNNEGDFADVPGLKVENWTVA